MDEKKRMLNKRGIVFLLFGIFAISIISASADIGMIVKDDARVQKNYLEVFKELNLSVEIIEDSKINSRTNFDQYEIIFVNDFVFNMRNTQKYLDISKHKTIIANPFEGEDYGLTDKDGISSLTSNNPLSVIYGNSIVQVYNSAYDNRRRALQYYYLSEGNIAPGLESVASTYKGGSEILGDVISIAQPGAVLASGKITQEKICFFGISNSDYWTPYAKQLFKDECVSFVAFEVECYNNLECNDDDEYTEDVCVNPGTYQSYCQHDEIRCLSESDCGEDGFIGENFCFEGNVNREYRDFSCLNEGTKESSCVFEESEVLKESCGFGCEEGICLEDPRFHDIEISDLKVVNDSNNVVSILVNGREYKILVDLTNNGNFSENVTFKGEINGVNGNVNNFSHVSVNNLLPNEKKDDKVRSVFLDVVEGNYNIVVEGIVNEDINLENNIESINVSVVECIENDDCSEGNKCVQNNCVGLNIICSYDDDCGEDGFIGENICYEGDVSREFIEYSCLNPGTEESSCSSSVENRTVENCSLGCSNGSCVIALCDENLDCNDGNEYTYDECVRPGMADSFCRNTEVNCVVNSDCGFTGFLGEEYCYEGNVNKNYQTAICKNGGSLESHCEISVSNEDVNICDYACFEGSCIRCDENLDCNDNNNDTIDSCKNSGSVYSYCENKPIVIPPICSLDSDCGNVSYSDNYCDGNDVARNLTSPLCSDKGTPQSSCSFTTIKESLQSCQYGCNEGMCNGPPVDIILDCESDEQSFNINVGSDSVNLRKNVSITSCEDCDYSDLRNVSVYVPSCIKDIRLSEFYINDGGDVIINGNSLRENLLLLTDCHYGPEASECSVIDEELGICTELDGNINITRYMNEGINEIVVEYCDKSGNSEYGFANTLFKAYK